MSKPLPPMTMEELIALPVAVDLRTAARALGITESRAYELARSGEFPVPLRRYGREWRASRASILRELDLDPLMVVSDLIRVAPAASASAA